MRVLGFMGQIKKAISVYTILVPRWRAASNPTRGWQTNSNRAMPETKYLPLYERIIISDETFYWSINVLLCYSDENRKTIVFSVKICYPLIADTSCVSDDWYDWRLTSCVILPMLSLAYAADDFGAVPSCGEDKSKSFTWAHKLDCSRSACALFT